jgi:uncharacterized protein (TIGR03083 family)
MDKAELLAKTRDARSRIDAAIARVPDDRMNEVSLYERWTIKDFVAHLAVWERYALDVADALSNGREPTYHFGTVPVDRINDATYVANKDRSLEDVRAEAVATYAALLTMIETAPDELLFDGTYWPYTQGYPFVAWIRSNADEHYDEHLPDVLAFLEQAGL